MVMRIDEYVSLLYQDLRKQFPDLEKYPFVFPIVIYNGKDKWTAPLDMADIIELPIPELQRYARHTRYCLIDLNDIDIEVLKELGYAISTIFLIDKITITELKELLDKILAAIYQIKDEMIREEVKGWLFSIVQRRSLDDEDMKNKIKDFEVKEYKSMLKYNLEEYDKELMQQGIHKGRQQGMQKGRIEIAENMLKEEIEKNVISKITRLSIDEIDEIEKIEIKL